MKGSKQLQVAIIGAGMGRYGLLPSFLQHPLVNVKAVCTSSKHTAEQFASQYHIPKAYDSWEKLLEEKIDILAIAVPPSVQGKITAAALKKKIPLFLEKQIALNVDESLQLQDLAIKHQIPTCVNFIFPYLQTWRLMGKLLNEQKLGQIRSVFLNWRMESYDNFHRTPDTWKTNDQLGGGILQHFLSHSFHYMEMLFGEIKELRCSLYPAPDLRPEGSTLASLDLCFHNGLIAHLSASSSAYKGIGHQLEIYGTEGSMILKNETRDPVSGFKLYYASRGQELELIESEDKYVSGLLYHSRVGLVNLDSAKQSKIEASCACVSNEEDHSQIWKADEENQFCEVAACPNLSYQPVRGIDSRVSPTTHLVNSFIETLKGRTIEHPTIAEGHRVQVLLNCARAANLRRCFVEIGEHKP